MTGNRSVSADRDNWQRSEMVRILDRVVHRLWLRELGRMWGKVMFGLGGLCFLVLLVHRLGVIAEDWITLKLLAGMPVIAALIVVLVVRKPADRAAARQIDTCCGSCDLLLTSTQIDSAAGAYQELTIKQAERLAEQVAPSKIVKWDWHRPVVRLFLGAGVLISAVLFLPQFDPFGAVDSANAAVAVRKELYQSSRETASRIAELAAKKESKGLGDSTDQMLSELAAELQQMRNDRSPLSPQELTARQREIENQWRNLRTNEEVSRLLEQSAVNQAFGPVDARARQWARELATGKTESVQEKFDALSENLEQLSSAGDATERQNLEQQTRKELAALQRFAENQLQSKPMGAALKRAMSQLDSGRLDPGLQSEAADAASESLKLAEAELQDIAQNAENLASLERALSAIQSARQLTQQNSKENADRLEPTVQDFVDQYTKLQGDAPANEQDSTQASRQGQPGQSSQQASSSQSGSSTSGEAKSLSSSSGSVRGESSGNGSGQSSLTPENDLAKTDFREMRESARIDTNRKLMTMRRQGLAEPGSSSQEYQQLVRELRQQVRTAIEVEEIPPGYVNGIRSYFDTLEQQSVVNDSGPNSPQSSDSDSNRQQTNEAVDEAP